MRAAGFDLGPSWSDPASMFPSAREDVPGAGMLRVVAQLFIS